MANLPVPSCTFGIIVAMHSSPSSKECLKMAIIFSSLSKVSFRVAMFFSSSFRLSLVMDTIPTVL